ncbi:MAG: AmmeMemoRadiSam system protein A [Deltaproteobacteria bacterium]|nr:AmmeMemoRadiSam system protein A [Deltaproteobacteria bacterium]
MVHPLILLARNTLIQHLGRGKPQTPPRAGKSPPQACFVSLKKRGELRGCIGTLEPTQPSLEDEVAANTLASATRDPRFSPVTLDELEEITLSIDCLSPPEPVKSAGELDPKRYGVIVTWNDRRGVLLPDLEGVNTAAEQIEICRKKAAIPPGVPVTLERFTVERIPEQDED